MSLKPEELTAYINKYPLTFTEDKSKTDASLSTRFKDAWVIARVAAKVLKENYGATRVVVFGSLTNSASFTRWSDIGLAVWDVPDDRFYAAVGAVTGLTSDFKIDLVDATC